VVGTRRSLTRVPRSGRKKLRDVDRSVGKEGSNVDECPQPSRSPTTTTTRTTMKKSYFVFVSTKIPYGVAPTASSLVKCDDSTSTTRKRASPSASLESVLLLIPLAILSFLFLDRRHLGVDAKEVGPSRTWAYFTLVPTLACFAKKIKDRPASL